MNNRHSSDFCRGHGAIERLFSSAGRIFQPERATLTDNNFENQLAIVLCKSKLVMGTLRYLQKRFFCVYCRNVKVTLHPELE